MLFNKIGYIKQQNINTGSTKSHSTVTSRLFTHIVSTEKMHKDMKGTKYTYSNGFF